MTNKTVEQVKADDDAIDQERIDRTIWKNAGIKPVREIAEETGLTPSEVLRRKADLLDSVDHLTIQQKRQRLLIELDGMARDARATAKHISSKFYAGTINAATAAIKVMLQELARMEKADNSKVDELNQKRVSELVTLMREVVDISVVEIATKFDLEENDLYEVFNRRMVEAAQKRDLA